MFEILISRVFEYCCSVGLSWICTHSYEYRSYVLDCQAVVSDVLISFAFHSQTISIAVVKNNNLVPFNIDNNLYGVLETALSLEINCEGSR